MSYLQSLGLFIPKQGWHPHLHPTPTTCSLLLSKIYEPGVLYMPIIPAFRKIKMGGLAKFEAQLGPYITRAVAARDTLPQSKAKV